MSIAGPHEATERLHYLASEAPRVGARAWIGAGLLAAVAAASGYYAYALHGERDAAQSALVTSEEQLRTRTKRFEEQLHELEQTSAAQRAQVTDLSKKLDDASSELAAANTSMLELVDERGELGAELAEFKQMSKQLSRMIDSGRLQVSFRRGRMVVELKAQVLFPSGSADLTADGKDALKEVAKSLRGFKGRHFIVAGHTDNIPVNGPFENNWALSSARALNVTGALIRAGLRPQQLVAAGYGEYDPIARNGTETGRQANRRIEIILEPRLRDVGSANH
ncbi:MAG TPA: flagellar motor protein MotB [Polyangiales bacterium]|nr:flagellar motor protein MotB [Polyangiales bacterium]